MVQSIKGSVWGSDVNTIWVLWRKLHSLRPSHVITKESPGEEYSSEILPTMPQVSGKLVAHVHLMWCLSFCLWHHGYVNEKSSKAVLSLMTQFFSLSTGILSNNQYSSIVKLSKIEWKMLLFLLNSLCAVSAFQCVSCFYIKTLWWEHDINSTRVKGVSKYNLAFGV